MLSDETLNALLLDVAALLHVEPPDALKTALVQLRERVDISGENDLTAFRILESAETLNQENGGFILEELLDSIFPNDLIFSPHKAKIQIGCVLAAAGYNRRQIRRSPTDRPLWWSRLQE